MLTFKGVTSLTFGGMQLLHKQDIDCKASNCVHNCFLKCCEPSRAIIDSAGCCKGFKIKSVVRIQEGD